jgi:hypothetical protein
LSYSTSQPKPLPSQRYLQRILNYDSFSGELYWKYRADRSPSWNTRRAGKRAGCFSKGKCGQLVLDGEHYMLHRIIYKLVYDKEPPEVDHKDYDPSNNRIRNLRAATHANNGWNQRRRKNNSSGVKGLYQQSYGSWYGQVMYAHKKYNTKTYANKDRAMAALIVLREQLHGRFANHG